MTLLADKFYPMNDALISRMKVFGGWIVKHEIHEDDTSFYGRDADIKHFDDVTRVTMVFIPDPNHEWESWSIQHNNLVGAIHP